MRTFSATESDPDSCIDVALTSVVLPLIHLAPSDYPNARVFLFNRFAKLADYTPGTGETCTTTTGDVIGTGIIAGTGTLPTFKVQNHGVISTPYL